MNSVIISVLLMLGLSIARVPVVAAIIISALVAGITSGMDISTTLAHFEEGIGAGATIALSYALLGAFAAAIGKTGIPQLLAQKLVKSQNNAGKLWLIGSLCIAAILSQNLIPIHIAFIPLVVPALLGVMVKLNLDRRAVACAISFGLVTTYMIIPAGFGGIYLNEILFAQIELAGVDVSNINVYEAMWLPAIGMCAGLLVALFISYRDPRRYQLKNLEIQSSEVNISWAPLVATAIAIVAAFTVQLVTGSMILGALAGFLIFSTSRTVQWQSLDSTFIGGMKLMANVGFIMIAAAGFAYVLKQTGDVPALVNTTAQLLDGSAAVGVLLMLCVGLFITMGIGSSFSTVPIIATLFVPLSLQLGLSPLATVALVGTAGALGDAGSPASDSTLGPTAGLNADGQHDHIRDTVIPTFFHFNIPLLIFGWLAAMTL